MYFEFVILLLLMQWIIVIVRVTIVLSIALFSNGWFGLDVLTKTMIMTGSNVV